MNVSISCMIRFFPLCCLLSLSKSTCTDLKDCFSKVRPGKLDGYIIKTFSNKGYRDCFKECFRHATVCRSFNYNKFTGLCELNSRTPDSATLNEVTTFVNSLIPSDQPNDPCSPNPCSPSQMCVVLSSGATTCVTECGLDLPQDETGRMMNDVRPYYKAGEHFVSSCPADNTKMHSWVCLANGNWKQTSSLCSMTCTFEEPCLYLQQDSNALPFRNRTGSTPNTYTGCSSDHTSGDGYYYYLESSGVTVGTIFRMITINPFHAGQQICVELWYHMYGNGMGSLFIQIQDQSGVTSDMKMAEGSQGQEWKRWTKTIGAQPTDVWLAIKGVRGSGYKSDICVDDVMMYLC